jgi:hypothetical protein
MVFSRAGARAVDHMDDLARQRTLVHDEPTRALTFRNICASRRAHRFH